MSVRRSIVVLFIVMTVTPVLVFNAAARRESAAESTRELQTAVVGRGDVEVTVTALGTIRSDQTANISFESAGRVTTVAVQTGDFVLAGDVLAEIDSDAQMMALEQAELARDAAWVQREQVMQGATEGQIEIAQANIDAAEAALYAVSSAVTAEDIQAAELAYAAAQQALNDAIQARATAPGGQSEEAYALLDARVGEASFNAETARLQLESVQTSGDGQTGAAYARVQQAEAELERVLAGPSQVEIDRADANVRQAELSVEQAQSALERTRLRAPFDGVISAVNIEVGGIAAPGLPAVQITDIDPLRLTVQVDEIDVELIREGQAARVSLDAIRDVEYDAVLERIALISTIDGGVVSYDVDVTLVAVDDPRVRVGMTAEASVVVEERRDVLVVPNLYIRLDRTTNRAYVNVLRGDVLEEIEVTLGLQGADSSEVTAGVREGDVVAVDLAGDAFDFGG